MKKAHSVAIFAIAACLLAVSCGPAQDPTRAAATDAPVNGRASATSSDAAGGAAPENLAGRLDCLREAGAMLVIAHRGGPTRDYPENALETLERTRRAGLRAVEIDIVRSRDGVLFLMHDETLDRATDRQGRVTEMDWDDIRAARLRTGSRQTDFHPPLLSAALEWTVENGVLMELDRKHSASFAEVIAEVRAAGAEDHVILITYNDDEAAEVHALAPDLVITATVNDTAQLDRLLARGVNPETLIAWTGIRQPAPDLWAALAVRGIESAFGTLGFGPERLDTVYWADNDGSEYNELAGAGLAFVVTDMSDKVSRQLAAEQARAAPCGL